LRQALCIRLSRGLPVGARQHRGEKYERTGTEWIRDVHLAARQMRGRQLGRDRCEGTKEQPVLARASRILVAARRGEAEGGRVLRRVLLRELSGAERLAADRKGEGSTGRGVRRGLLRCGDRVGDRARWEDSRVARARGGRVYECATRRG